MKIVYSIKRAALNASSESDVLDVVHNLAYTDHAQRQSKTEVTCVMAGHFRFGQEVRDSGRSVNERLPQLFCDNQSLTS